jgi:S1-C subfamily serine protease
MPTQLRTLILFAFTLCLIAPATGQVKVTTYNEQGATAPCLGIGVGVLIVKKCVSAFEKQGFIRSKELGDTGMVLGTAGASDGVITAIVPASPAASAGLQPGDVILSIDGKPAHPVAADIIAQLSFFPIQNDVHLKVLHQGTPQTLTFARIPATPPPAPKGAGFPTVEHFLVNWRGQIAPCIGMPPTQSIAFSYCDSHFKPFGFVTFSDFSVTGFTINRTILDRPIVAYVQPGTPAAKAGLTQGDEIVEIDGGPPTVSAGANAKMLLFGRIGDKRSIVYRRGTAEQTAVLTLVPRTQEDKDEEAAADPKK